MLLARRRASIYGWRMVFWQLMIRLSEECPDRLVLRRVVTRIIAGLLFCTGTVMALPVSAQPESLPPAAAFRGKVMRDPDTGRLVLQPPVLEIHVCVDKADDPACDMTDLQAALDGVSPGGKVVMHPGIYRQAAYVRYDRTRIEAQPGAALVGTTVAGKAALVITANDVVIDGLSCSEITVRDRNGACIRLEGNNLTLRNVHFFDSEQGILSGGDRGLLLIEDSRFENLGRAGRAHGIYVGGGELIVRRSIFLASKDEGHEIKSRAARTLIEDNVIASLGAVDSYLIDVPNGGVAIIRRNILQEGTRSANDGAVAFAMEGDRHENSSILVAGNLIFMDRRRGTLIKAKGHKATLSGNVIVGPPGQYRIGESVQACGDHGNICVDGREGLSGLSDLPLPRIPKLGRLLTETGLWKH